MFFFVAILLLSIEPTTLFLLGWILIGGSALPPTTATTTAVKWQRPLLLVAWHVPHGRHLPTTCGRHCSSEHTPRLGFGPSCWSPGTHHTYDTFRVRADDATLRNTLLVSASGRISSPPAVSYRPLRSETAQAPPIRLACSALCQHVTLHISASCQHKPQDRPSTCIFLRFAAEAHARRATKKHTGINPSNDHRRGLRLLREPIGQHTPLKSEPGRPSRDPLGLRVPCSRSSCRRSFFAVLPGKEQAVLVECLGFFLWRIFQYTRYRMGFSTCVDRSCASDKLLCPISAENGTAANFDAARTPPRSSAINSVPLRHVAPITTMFTTVRHNGLVINTCHIPTDSLLYKSLYSSRAAYFAPVHPPHSSTLR